MPSRARSEDVEVAASTLPPPGPTPGRDRRPDAQAHRRGGSGVDDGYGGGGDGYGYGGGGGGGCDAPEEMRSLSGSADGVGGGARPAPPPPPPPPPQKGSIVRSVVGAAVVAIPKIQAVEWWKFLALSIAIAIPAASYVLLFTKMGGGLEVYNYVSEKLEFSAWYIAVSLGAFMLALYMLDFSYWDSRPGRVLRKLSWVGFVAGCMATVLFMSGDYPYAPICLFAVYTPLWLVLIKRVFFLNSETRTYVSWLSGPLFFVSLCTFFSWLGWTFARDENEWNEVTELEYAEEAGCEPNFDEYPQCRGPDGRHCFVLVPSPPDIVFPVGCDEACVAVYDECLNTFILWVGPMLVSLSLFFLSFFCTFLRTEGTNERDVVNFGKLWIFLLFAMWVTASLSGIATGVTSALVALTLASFAGSVVFAGTALSRPDQQGQVREVLQRMTAKYGGYMDIVKGLAVLVGLPPAIVYIWLSFFNQFVRRLGCLRCSKSIPSPEVHEDWVTERTRGQITAFKAWDRSKVFTYAIYWGIGFICLQVLVAQFTVLFLSWLIEQTSSMSLAAVTGIMIGVGIVMFLLPPVPGLPIYLTLGMVIVAIGKDTMGYAGAMAYSSAVSLFVKLFACALQQKMIGENLSHFTSVRQMVGINTRLIRSMRLVLADPGLSLAKVSILIGGPDWPTSVLCGIMGLDLLPILLGTLPVIFLVVPTALSGSFTYMASLQDHGTPLFPWAGVAATICSAGAAAVLFGNMLMAAHYVERTITTRGDEVEGIPIDEEVRRAEERSQAMNAVYSEATQWAVLPRLAKYTLLASLVLMVACCYMVQLFPTKCFAEFELTYTITDHLDGDWTNLFLPLGRAAIVVFFVSCVLLNCFTFWASRKASRMARARSTRHLSPA